MGIPQGEDMVRTRGSAQRRQTRNDGDGRRRTSLQAPSSSASTAIRTNTPLET